MTPGTPSDLATRRALVRRLVEESTPHGETFEACRAVLRGEPASEMAHDALCMLLEGALADATLSIRDTQVVVPLLKELARGSIGVGELL
ncbi:MAG: hypothetical protein LJE95_07740 [Acidobacteria bacterium]|jgi:hypothetical protein|nr:hypothetical protein [Acidobacteriota bacterium]